MHPLLLLVPIATWLLHVAFASQPGATQPTSWPAGPLVWGEVNFLYTTDTHGWLMGHTKSAQAEPNYSGDLGDLLSFVKRMKEIAANKGVDLLLVDSGDIHDGTGLTDGGPEWLPGAHESNKFITRLPYDVLASGNHELYVYHDAVDTYRNFIPHWNGTYLASNVNITLPAPYSTNTSVPLGDPYVKFTTAQGKQVTAFGILFRFKSTLASISVQTVSALVEEPWFQAAIADAPDFFLLAGHMAVPLKQRTDGDTSDWWIVYEAIRQVHKDIPILVFGGHSHIRNCITLGDNGIAVQAGRFMETVGWLSVNLTGSASFSRKFLDPNRNTYKYHTQTSEDNFDTPEGLALTSDITNLMEEWNLNEVFGYAPQNYYFDRIPPAKDSVLNLFLDSVLPTVLPMCAPEREHIPLLALYNGGALTYDIWEGPFTRDDQYKVMAYKNAFLFVTVPWRMAKGVTDTANNVRSSEKARWDGSSLSTRASSMQPASRLYSITSDSQTVYSMSEVQLSPGYVTKDNCQAMGTADDSPHVVIHESRFTSAWYSSPWPSDLEDSDLVDVIFPSFRAEQIVQVLNILKPVMQDNYTVEGLNTYCELTSDHAFELYAKTMWRLPEE